MARSQQTAGIGRKRYTGQIKSSLGAMTKGRKIIAADDGCQLREPSSSYMSHFDTQKDDIEPYNAYYWELTN